MSKTQPKMLNLNHIYKKLTNSYKNVNFSLLESISYITTLAKPSGKILLIYTENKTVSPHKQEIAANISDETSKLELTGTPLEDDFQIDVIDDFNSVKEIFKSNAWTDEEETYSSVHAELARNIINSLNMDEENDCVNGSVFAICDGVNGSQRQFLLDVQCDGKWNWRGIAHFIGLIPFTEIDISTMMRKHLSCLRNCNKANTMIETHFNINFKQTIKLSWVTTLLTPTIQYNKNADVLLTQTVPIGNYESSIEEFWRQLEILEGIQQDIVKYKKHENNKNLVYNQFGSSLPFDAIKEHVVEVLSNISPVELAKEMDTFDIESVISRMEAQRMLSVTDQLWNVLKFCSSYQDLLNSLQYIFQCSAQSIVVNMPSNDNRLACIIREISENRLVVPRLSGSEPLEILLEIGLQKISKDYEYIFTDSKICSSMAFQSFIKDVPDTSAEPVPLNIRKTLHHAAEARKTIKIKNEMLDDNKPDNVGFEYTHFDKVEVDRKLAKLAQIHLILHHMLLMQINLNLDNTVFGPIMNNLPKTSVEFARLKTMKYDKREFPLLGNKIMAKIENRNPDVVNVSMKSENKFKRIESTYFFSVDPICPLNIFPYMQSSEDVVNKEILYCALHYAKIGSNLK